MKLLHKGKVKEVYPFGDDKLLFHFTDQISVFDKIIPTLVPRKGEALARTGAHWFKECEARGIATHFIGLQSPTSMLVKRVEIIRDYDRITPNTRNFLLPLEVICRHYVAGSLLDRIKAGEIKPEHVGLPAGKIPEYATKLPQPFIEFTTKLEATDRPLSDEEAQRLAALTDKEFAQLKDAVLRVDDLIAEQAARVGLIHVDGKKEFAMDHHRNLMVVDTFGTLDEDRWWDKKLFEEQGKPVELSKEMVRQHYRETGYHAALYAARKAGAAEPPIPALPAHVVEKVTELYVGLFTRLTGEEW